MKSKTRSRTLLVVTVLALASLSPAATYALVIGVNAYPDPVGSDGKILNDEQGDPIHPQLDGAVNDANSMRDLLLAKYKVPKQHVRELTDSAVTENGFVDGMKWLVHSARAGDQVVFYFSGHGGHLKDAKSADGYEGVIVLADETLIPGRVFGEIAKDLADDGINATFVFDSCYSGAMSRSALTRSKYYKSLESIAKAKKLPLRELQHAVARDPAQTSAASETSGTFAFLFASARDQSAAEVGAGKYPAHGLFTLALQLLLEDDPKVSIRQMFDLFVPTMAKLKFEQVPVYETSKPSRSDKPLVWR